MGEPSKPKALLACKETESEFKLKSVEFRGKTPWTTPDRMDTRFVDDQKMVDVLAAGRRGEELDDELQRKTLASLKRLAREYHLKLTGRKQEIVQRVAAAMKRKQKIPENDLLTYTCLKCSPLCNALAYEFPLDFASNTQCRGRVVVHGKHLEKIVTNEDMCTIYMILSKPAKAQFVHVADGSKTYTHEDEPWAVFGTGPSSRPDLDKDAVTKALSQEDIGEGQDILLSRTHVLAFECKDDFHAAVATLENGAGIHSGFKSIMEPFPLAERDADDFLQSLDTEFTPNSVSHEPWNDEDEGDGSFLDNDERESLYFCRRPKLTLPDYSFTHSDFLDHIDLDACSEWARKSIQRWGLQPPFDPHIDDVRWKLYYMERATVEWWNKANGNMNYEAIWNNFGSSFGNGIRPIPDGECLPWNEEFPKPDLLTRVVFSVNRSRHELIFEVKDMQEGLQESTEWIMDGCLHLQDHFENVYKRKNVSKMFSDGIYVLRPPISDTGYDGDENQVIAYACRCYSPFAIGTSFDVYFDHLHESGWSCHDHTNVFVRPRDIIDCDASNIFQPPITTQRRFLWCAYALHPGKGSRAIKSEIDHLSPEQLEYLLDPVGAQSFASERGQNGGSYSSDSSDLECYGDEDVLSGEIVCDTGGVLDGIESVLEGGFCPTPQLSYLLKLYRHKEWCVRVAMRDEVNALVHRYFGMKQPVSDLKMFSWIFYMANRYRAPCDLKYVCSGDSMIASTVADFSSWLYGKDQYGELASIYPKAKHPVVSDPFFMVRSPRLQTTRPMVSKFERCRQEIAKALEKIKAENPNGRIPVSVPLFESSKNPWIPKRVRRRSKEDYYSEGCFCMDTLNCTCGGPY